MMYETGDAKEKAILVKSEVLSHARQREDAVKTKRDEI